MDDINIQQIEPHVSRDLLKNVGHRIVVGTPNREYYYFLPETIKRDTHIIVSVHGVSMNAAEHLFRFIPEARKCNAILIAPLFDKKAYGKYQQLEDPKSGARSDTALLDILSDLKNLTGVNTDRFYLAGYSGGAQFAHRFAIYYANRVICAVLCASGWYSFPDANLAYPHGILKNSGPSQMSPHSEWLTIPFHVLVGKLDRKRDKSLNRTAIVDRQQGKNRVQRAKRWVKEVRSIQGESDLNKVTLTVIDNLGHDFSQAVNHHCLGRLIFEKFNIPSVKPVK